MSYHRRLATLLGADPAQATADDVRKLLNNPLAAEGQDLDHKLEPHANGTEGGGELAKDIAAFANSTGGVLVLGLQDDRKTSIPVHASPIQLTDGLRRRYSETLASRTAPILDVDIHFAKETHTLDGQVPLGFALVMVPPSPRSPHAVLGLTDLRDGCLRFPVRSGSRTRFMNPTEVETAFLDKQNRHAQRELRHDQLLDAIEEQKGFSPVRTSAPVPPNRISPSPWCRTLPERCPGTGRPSSATSVNSARRPPCWRSRTPRSTRWSLWRTASSHARTRAPPTGDRCLRRRRQCRCGVSVVVPSRPRLVWGQQRSAGQSAAVDAQHG